MMQQRCCARWRLPAPAVILRPPHSLPIHRLSLSADGGTDDLPDTINASAAQSGTHILVATTGSGSVGGSGGAGSVDALLCCQQRRDVLWLWGARTREEKRGCGLAELLLVSVLPKACGWQLNAVGACWPVHSLPPPTPTRPLATLPPLCRARQRCCLAACRA